MRRFLCIPGQPQGKARARTVLQGGKVHSYTPAKTAAYEALVAGTYKTSFPDAETATGAVEVAIRAIYEVPKSWPRKRKQEALAGLIPVTTKPDCDNILKIVADALNGVAWVDDSQIVFAKVRKAYGAEARVEVEIWTEQP